MTPPGIIHLAEKIHLAMDIGEFRELFPRVALSVPGEEKPSTGFTGSSATAAHGTCRIAGGHGECWNCFFTFDSGALVFYEINAQFGYDEANYELLSGLFGKLRPVLTERYGTGSLIHPPMDYAEFREKELPSDGYPCDRYVIGGMHRWSRNNANIDLSFSLISPGYLFFQLRAILLS